jgi:hypothetical protein
MVRSARGEIRRRQPDPYEHHSESRVRPALACRCSGSSRCSASPDDGGCRRERTLGAVGPPWRRRILRFVALVPCQCRFTRGHCLLARLVSKTCGPTVAATRHPRSQPGRRRGYLGQTVAKLSAPSLVDRVYEGWAYLCGPRGRIRLHESRKRRPSRRRYTRLRRNVEPDSKYTRPWRSGCVDTIRANRIDRDLRSGAQRRGRELLT